MQGDLYQQTSCVILSAGSSLRMGGHKALLPYDKDRNFIQKVTALYLEAGIEQLIVVVNAELMKLISRNQIALSEKVQLVVNEAPELGRFFSLQTGLRKVKPGNACFFQNIDNPFTSARVLQQLIRFKKEAEVLIPASGGKCGHPVLIMPQVVKAIISEPGSNLRIDSFLDGFTQLKVEVDDALILANINLPGDYREAGFKDGTIHS